MKSMKKILTLLLVVALAGAMATTAFAAPETHTDTPVSATQSETALVIVSKAGDGQIAISDDGSEPVFDDFPSQNPSVQAAVGDTIILSAKADEGAGSLHTGSIWIQRSLSPWMPLSRWK